MENTEFIEQRVKQYYWVEALNCATTTLKVLSELYNIELAQQVIDSSLGMHGAGKYGAQCGLVEGTLLFIGILGRARNHTDDRIVETCYLFAESFEKQFSSILCRELRPQGFSPEQPLHLCADITSDALCFIDDFIRKML